MSDSDTKPTIDPRLQAVTDALRNVEPPGDLFCSGECTLFPQPAITVEGLGEIALPVLGDAAKALVDKCHLAPFGHGEKTLVDTQVRNTWELSTSQFRLGNAAWQKFIQDQIVPAIHLPLGIHASMDVEAKLYKMLLYEVGGKFERHKDSEKEDGMFGTLVVVLPGRFEGGELIVHDPMSVPGQQQQSDPRGDHTKSYTWDPASMDPHTIKYAAFYGDCPHEVKPVTKGYRLCLTYNLVTVGTNASEPRFGANHPLYATLKTSLCEFFSKERTLGSPQKFQRLDESGAKQSTDFDLADPQRYRSIKLVYVLTHQYTKAGLSFQYLKNKDALVAQCLARICAESKGALGLYLCKIKYEFSWEGPEDSWCYDSDGEEVGDVSKQLTLLSPWVKNTGFVGVDTPTGTERYVQVKASTTEDMGADLWNEVAPAGMFDAMDDDKFDGKNAQEHTGDEGAVLEKWYSSAALVVMPLVSRVRQQFRTNPPAVLDEWLKMARKKPRRARAIAAAIRYIPNPWSLTSDKSLRVLDGLQKFKHLDVVRHILMSCVVMEFQPKLRDVVQSFCHEAVASMLTRLSQHWAKHKHCKDWAERNRVNIVASVLHGETDPTTIKTILNSVELKAKTFPLGKFDCIDHFKGDTMPTEYVRLLVLASCVSKTFESNLYCKAKEQLAALTLLLGNADTISGSPTL